jgi:hypothetical protein
MARCPAHDDSEPSLAIRNDRGRTLVHCHAGCEQKHVLAVLRARGLWDSTPRPALTSPSAIRNTEERVPLSEDRIRRTALRLWATTQAATGTLVEHYLASRCLTLTVPATLRFHPGLRHPAGDTWPAMVALVTSGVDDEPLAIHRTFLAHDGCGKAPVKPQKMMLGPCRGGAVRLAKVDDILLVGEGIETCLSAMQATGHPAWAALSAPGLRRLDLPEAITRIIVLADGDEPGERAAMSCARRWTGEGRDVRIARPPHGSDFNDLLLRGRAFDKERTS